MASHGFEHLPLVRRQLGEARLHGRSKLSEQTLKNRADRGGHSSRLRNQANTVSRVWQSTQAERKAANLPSLGSGIPLLLEIDPKLSIDSLRHHFQFEIVSEQEDGYVIVASEDRSLSFFQKKLRNFVDEIRGSAGIASIHSIQEDLSHTERLRRILSPRLFEELPSLNTTQPYIVDLSVNCEGCIEIPPVPKRGKRSSDREWAKKLDVWNRARSSAYEQWDQLWEDRKDTVREFLRHYKGEILNDSFGYNEDGTLPNDFQIRIRISAIGLKDLIFNHPYIFEVSEPEDVELPQAHARQLREVAASVRVVAPDANAPAVCVIDSGIQEEHILLGPAIDKSSSFCFLPKVSNSDVADYVANGGHGTRVAGAILYGESIPESGQFMPEAWIQNARILDRRNRLPRTVLPSALLRRVVLKFHTGSRRTRIFNHSVNSSDACRTRHMSGWAAEIDRLCNQYDVLIIQSVGNLQPSQQAPLLGITELVSSGKDYPDYLNESCCRLANPSQSLQAITVGSVASGVFEDIGWKSFARQTEDISAFSRSGFGMWNSIKPDVVEFGGDFLRTSGNPPSVALPPHASDCYPNLIRSTMNGGPPFARDIVGTSFAAPKVTRIAVRLQNVLPTASCLLYRALIIQSARWPDWARGLSTQENAVVMSRLGYGRPDIARATTNDEFRTTFISDDELQIRKGECHIFQVPIPPQVRRAGSEFVILVEVTLSYSAETRRSRRSHRGYLSVWMDWTSNRTDEPLDAFISRAIKSDSEVRKEGTTLPWTIGEQGNSGQVSGVRRGIGTVQKDWAYVPSSALPKDFCVAVRGRQGWSKDPDSTASYALTVSFEIVGKEIPIYDAFRVELDELQESLELEAEAEIDD